jgi:hypothetical protein
MFPRRYTRRRRYSSGTQRATRRLLLIAAAACVPVLIIAYAVTATHGGRAVDTADVTGAGLRPGSPVVFRGGGCGQRGGCGECGC